MGSTSNPRLERATWKIFFQQGEAHSDEARRRCRGWDRAGRSCLLEMPQVRQGDHDDAKHEAVDDEHAQSIGLQIPNEPYDGGVTDHRGDENANQEWSLHPGGEAFLVKFVRL